MPTWDDEPNLPYMRSLIKEIHRFGPIASLGKRVQDVRCFPITSDRLPPAGIPHCATQEDVYKGRTVPKGTIVFPNLTALSKDPERYSEPYKFAPERFAKDDRSAAVSALSKNYMDRDHFHYGFGRRLCPGVHVAEASLFIVISRILWAFDIRPVKHCKLDLDAKTSK